LVDNVTRHVEREKRALAGWKELARREYRRDDAPVIEVTTRWRGGAGLVYQRQAHIGLARAVLLIVANGPIEQSDTCDRHLARALETFRARRD
jgi:hypothetical protein